MKTDTTLVEAQGVGIYKSGRWLIRNVHLQVRRNEIVSLIGPNGGGKTTTARTVLGILRPDEGRCIKADRLCIGYLPQRLRIDWTFPFTVRRLLCLTRKYSVQQMHAVLDAVGARELYDAQVRNLSGGEYQRVLLARAIIREPQLLVLDEPLQGVDFPGEIALFELIRTIRDRYQCGILLISHDLHMVMAQTDRVICLNHRVCCSGSPQSVAGSTEYHRLFGARAAEVLAIYQHHHEVKPD